MGTEIIGDDMSGISSVGSHHLVSFCVVCFISSHFLHVDIAGSHDLLVLIDQHAAHERVRVEALTAGTFKFII